jgi:hypothetical protein
MLQESRQRLAKSTEGAPVRLTSDFRNLQRLKKVDKNVAPRRR